MLDFSHRRIVRLCDHRENTDGIITSWNEGAEKVYGYVAAEVIGRPISILIPDDLPNELPNILNRVRKGEVLIIMRRCDLRKDDQRIRVALTVSRLGIRQETLLVLQRLLETLPRETGGRTSRLSGLPSRKRQRCCDR